MIKKRSPKAQITKSLIFGVMVICIVGANIINNKIAKYRSRQLIKAVEQYHQDNSYYPEKLSDLVPAYIPKVPIAKYSLVFNEFWYYSSDCEAFLNYVVVPLNSMQTYGFNSKKWRRMD
jgi:hypothetical protein